MINKRLILAVSFGLITSANVHAESIFEAMTEAYNTNPVLQGQRATSGIANEDAALARSGFRPVISANSSYTDSHTHTKPTPTNDGYGKGYNAQVSQSLFSGLQTYNAVRAADQAAKAGIHTLYETEQNVLLNASKAYLDVLRDEAIVKLQKNNEKLLKKQLDETLARFDVGEVTRTDVAQSRASYAQAQSDLISAEGNLEISKANYLHYVGNQPDDLKTPEGLQKFFPV
ncbi:MAG: TolC family protein, partial [Alphaproteobacteria bacterium]|nr:TolC family protein [Alphaproteobacteria bacterium]